MPAGLARPRTGNADPRGADHAALAAGMDAVLAARGTCSLATAAGRGGERPGRGDFYSDTAAAALLSHGDRAPPPALRWRRPGLGGGGGARARPWRGECAACAWAAGAAGRERLCGRAGRGGGGGPGDAAPPARRSGSPRPGGGQEGAARVLSFCWTARLAGLPGRDASRPRGPGSAAATEARGPRDVGGLDLRPGVGSRGAAVGSLPPSSGLRWRLLRGMRSPVPPAPRARL